MLPTPSPRRLEPPPPIPPDALPPAPITAVLVALNLAVFAAEIALDGLHGLQSVSTATLLAFGGNHGGATLYEGRIETLLTSCFVHGSLLHVAFNVVALRQVGGLVERTVGSARTMAAYVVTGVAGSVASTFSGWLSGGQHLSVGASGAICGLIGAGAVLGYRIQGRESPVLRQMVGWLASLLALGLAVSLLFRAVAGQGGGFDNAAHAGGAVAGALVASLFRREAGRSREVEIGIVALCVALVVAAAVRVVRYDLNDPLATMTVDARLTFADRAVDDGRCRDARMALDSVERLTRAAPEVAVAEARYRARCAR